MIELSYQLRQEQTEKPPSPKNFTLKIPAEKLAAFNELIATKLIEVNQKERGRKLTTFDLFEHLLQKMDATDVKILQERSLSKWDKICQKFEQYNQDQGTSISLEDYIAKHLRIN